MYPRNRNKHRTSDLDRAPSWYNHQPFGNSVQGTSFIMNYDNQDYYSQNQNPGNNYNQQNYGFGSFDYSQQNNAGGGMPGGQSSSYYPSSFAPITDPFGGSSNSGGGGFGSGNGPQGSFDNQFAGEMSNMDDPFANEPPLLVELGINFEHIIQKTFCVLNP